MDIAISYFTIKGVDLCFWHYNNCFKILMITGNEEELEKTTIFLLRKTGEKEMKALPC